MNDTPPEIEALVDRMMAERTPEERLRMGASMFDAARELMAAGLLMEDPNLTRAQLRGRLFLRTHGDCFTPKEIDRIMAAIPDMERQSHPSL